MPDHAHLLVEGREETSNLRQFAKLAKQRSGGVFRRRTGEVLWQEGYYDRVLRQDDDAKDVARYIIENPVRAGLVKTPVEYAYVGSDVWSLTEVIESVV